MNLLGHAHVALALGADAETVLGAVAPDLASMARVRLDRERLTGGLGEGVRCHVAADAAFHGHAAFRAGAGALRRDLAARGVARGPVRAVGHAGWELLLDGTLLGSPADAAFRDALHLADRVGPAVVPPDRARWAAFVGRVGAAPALRYDDPRWVADRLHGMLAHRPRLRLRDADVAAVAEVLAARVPDVRRVAPAVLDDVTAACGA